MSDYTDGFEVGARWASLNTKGRGGVVTAPGARDLPEPPEGTERWQAGWLAGVAQVWG